MADCLQDDPWIMNPVMEFLLKQPYVIILTLLVILALPVGIRRRSFKLFFVAVFQVAIGILIPLAWFVLSAALIPDWKGDSVLGWVGCFVEGKMWLAPLVLWAACAFYARVVWKAASPHHTWIVLGYCSGAVVCNICLILALIAQYKMILWLWPFTVPVGVAIYYTRCAIRLVQENRPSIASAISAGFANASLTGLSVWQSTKVYQQLPDAPPSCFVVTAAACGHGQIVGPHFTIQRAGKRRLINQQLLTFWAFEDVWKMRQPRLHRIFRRFYNRLGPIVAARINQRWMADLTYLALKPFEWVAAMVLKWTR